MQMYEERIGRLAADYEDRGGEEKDGDESPSLLKRKVSEADPQSKLQVAALYC